MQLPNILQNTHPNAVTIYCVRCQGCWLGAKTLQEVDRLMELFNKGQEWQIGYTYH